MKRAFTLVELIVVVAIVLILAVILWPTINRPPRGHYQRVSCQSNLKQIGLALMQYTQDADDKFPRSHKGSRGWWQDLQPYIKGWPLFQCPSTSNHVLKTTDYFYNSRFQGLKTEDLVSQTQTIMSGDGPDDAPLSSHLSGLPLDATNEKSFAQRHLEGANYGFADGHVKWLKPEKIVSGLSMTSSEPTFAVR